MLEQETTSPAGETTRTIRDSSRTLTRNVALFFALLFGLPFFGALAGICGLFVATGLSIGTPAWPPETETAIYEMNKRIAATSEAFKGAGPVSLGFFHDAVGEAYDDDRYDYIKAMTPVIPYGRPNPPTGLTVRRSTDSHPLAYIDWDAAADSQVSWYKILRVDDRGNEETVAEPIPIDITEHTDDDLPLAGATYTYTIQAVNSRGPSEPSASASVQNGAPNAPTGLWALLDDGNEATISWSAPESSYVEWYDVYRREGNGPWTQLGGTVRSHNYGDRLSTTDRSIRPGTTYVYYVVARNGTAQSDSSTPFSLDVP